MSPRQRTRATFVAKPDLVSAVLRYPVSMTTGTVAGSGFNLTGNQFGSLGQDLIRVKDSSGNVRWRVGIVGGVYTIGRDIRGYNPAGTAYVALSGRNSIGCIEFPDGASAQGGRLWGGTGAPSASTVGTAAAGDHYLRREPISVATLVAASHSSSVGTISVGSGTLAAGTKDLDGVPQAGDLLIFIVAGNDATVTATVGADSGITATGTDGGVTADDGTRRLRYFSRVVQAGDISGNQISAAASVFTAGTGHAVACLVFRHALGFTTTGSKHGAALAASATDTTGGAGPFTLSATGPAAPSVAIAACYRNGTAPTNTFQWDQGSTADTSADISSSGLRVACKPARGTNSSGAAAYTTGGTRADVTAAASANVLALAAWAAGGGAITTDPLFYICTAGGTPGTWQAVL